MDFNNIAIIVIIFFFIVCLILKISSKYAVGSSILFIGVTAVLLIQGNEELANNVAIVIIYLLIAAFGLVIVENFIELKNKEKKKME